MSFLSAISKPVAAFVASKLKRESHHAVVSQKRIFQELLQGGKNRAFGRDHGFSTIQSYEDFRNAVPVRDYEALKPYIERVITGEADVLWRGKPLYLSKTSGTTSGAKFIPITTDSLSNHLDGARNAMLSYIAETGKADFLTGKLVFISGSPELKKENGINIGRLSGIVNHHVPSYLRRNQLPTWKTNCIEDFEEKIRQIVDETISENVTMISGIPPWVQMYLDKVSEKTGKKIKDVFPNLCLFIYGGVNYEPYRKKFEQRIGKTIPSIELYPASEAFIAFQDSQQRIDLLLNANSGVFFEFIPSSEYYSEHPKRISLEDVKTGVDYAIIINNNAGLWGYALEDTVKFTSVNPYRLLFTGRIKQYISAFGEHVIVEEVEKALLEACAAHHAHVVEFTVAPQVNPVNGEKPFHEWFIEFDSLPQNLNSFSESLNASLKKQNVYYRDLIDGHVLQTLKVRALKRDSFINYMRSQGKLGGQNKVPRLANDRRIADALEQLKVDH